LARPQKIEARALRVLDDLQRGRQLEDNTVELTARLPEAAAAARRIAGHLNVTVELRLAQSDVPGSVTLCLYRAQEPQPDSAPRWRFSPPDTEQANPFAADL
jgi:hypothetical protein